MVDPEVVAAALAETGTWVKGPFGTAEQELLRVEIRRACRNRGIRVRTGISGGTHVYACTPDGLPAEEPWRGAAVHVAASGVMDDVLRDAVGRAFRDLP